MGDTLLMTHPAVAGVKYWNRAHILPQENLSDSGHTVIQMCVRSGKSTVLSSLCSFLLGFLAMDEKMGFKVRHT